ncbi:aminoglycoside phosphotransferase family protein [Kitasatospora purpeofusca]|uniref:phosphotransferase family protein n=1 Tax=Kitasatospora purpeofusca TaxID=67352 RepID=UPI002A5A8509|nr:aminoglycoside phosphotransferase family protein [Kitasatospora purpeofusca]MDY0810667.1 aminoglycoside phosphotransferase family protein [Kitasatospora purpeofusca]
MLPLVETDEQWDAVVPDEAVMRPGVEDLCARLGLRGPALERFPEGSQPVYALGAELVLKLYPKAAAEDGLTEARVLAHVGGRLPVPTPELHDAGEYENGWRYVLMSRLRGAELAPAWADLSPGGRERIAVEAGETLAALHALDPGPLAEVLGPGDWGAFTDRQRAGAVGRQRERGLPDAWLELIPGFLDTVELPREPERVLLHTEFMRQHLLLDPATGRLSGLFDFEPAMIGDRAYDFVGVGVFVTRAEPGLMARFTAGYGRSVDPRAAMAWTLLHVYSNLPRYLREVPPPPGAATLESLAEHWFGPG